MKSKPLRSLADQRSAAGTALRKVAARIGELASCGLPALREAMSETAYERFDGRAGFPVRGRPAARAARARAARLRSRRHRADAERPGAHRAHREVPAGEPHAARVPRAARHRARDAPLPAHDDAPRPFRARHPGPPHAPGDPRAAGRLPGARLAALPCAGRWRSSSAARSASATGPRASPCAAASPRSGRSPSRRCRAPPPVCNPPLPACMRGSSPLNRGSKIAPVEAVALGGEADPALLAAQRARQAARASSGRLFCCDRCAAITCFSRERSSAPSRRSDSRLSRWPNGPAMRCFSHFGYGPAHSMSQSWLHSSTSASQPGERRSTCGVEAPMSVSTPSAQRAVGKHELHRLARVVRHGEGRDLEVADRERSRRIR